MTTHIGVQLHAPEGFDSLEKGRVYHLLSNDSFRARVLLVTFVERPPRPKSLKAKYKKFRRPAPMPVIHVLPQSAFETALLAGRIARVEPQAALPPWLGQLSSIQLAHHDDSRRAAKRAHEDRIDQILAHLWPLMERIGDILGADDPSRIINRHARTCRPPQHETRLRCWFFTYVCFGRNRWALHYPVHTIGHWDRMAKAGQKFGRPSVVKGANHGYGSNDPEVIKKIEEGYRRFAGPGVHLSAIYRKTMTKIFGCTTANDGFGHRHFVQPQGLPIPTQSQFSYRINQLFPLEERQITKFGAARARNRNSPPKGHFYESVGNLMERVEADAYVVDEVAEGYLPGSHLPRLIVVRVRCQASGMLVGIGFSVGGERASAYRMAKFSMAIEKVKFCGLFGHKITPEEWPCIGLSPHEISDRGPGMTRGARSRTGQGEPVIAEGAPSHMGQSKAVVESSNPRAVKLEGGPTYVTTRLTLPQLAWREINRTIRENHSVDVTNRLNNTAVVEGVGHTPLDVWNFLDARARTSATPMLFDDAVRAFLTPIEILTHPYGVIYLNQVFDSPELRATGLHARGAAGQAITLNAYMFDVCLRHLWIEYEGQLVEVDAQLAIADGEEQLYVSVVEVEQIALLRRQEHRKFLDHRQAETAHWDERFEAETGVAADQGTRKSGRAKRNNVASIEERRAIMPHLQGRKGAGK